MDKLKDWIYDLETFKDVFTFSIVRSDGKNKVTFECSRRKNQFDRIENCIEFLKKNECRLVGFNNVGFDYPILHKLLTQKRRPKSGEGIAKFAYELAQKQIDSFKDGFGETIKSDDQIVKQVDLYRIHHFNNKAKATSLKMIEFNMRLDQIEDLPFKPDADLTDDNIEKIVEYNEHDVECTRKFYIESLPSIEFRYNLSEKLGKDFTNADDTKIGAEYFQMELQKVGVKLKKFKDGKEVLNQTKRNKIVIKDILFDYYKFSRPEFKAVHAWFAKQVITETKGVFSDIEEHELGELAQYSELTVKKKRFKVKPTDLDILDFKSEHHLGWIVEEELKATEYAFDSEGNHILEYQLDEDGCPDLTKKQKKKRIPKKSYWGHWNVAETLNVLVDGYRIDFGVGGIHASLSEKVVKETKSYMIRDADVSSMYPNIAISNKVYPLHLGTAFCSIYQDMYEQRKAFPKGSAENAMLKLALNGTYGKSNDKYSVFYDPQFTMAITINGQLSLLMLADRLLKINALKLVQLNTDGVTVAMLRSSENEYKEVCKQWEADVKLDLEFVDYSKMIIRDVNNYIANYTNAKVKRKGAYQYEGLGWHMNQSSLVIPMAAEAEMLKGIPVEEFIRNHTEIFDFLLRTKVPRSSRLVLEYEDREEPQQNICRYYVANNGGKLVKIMPPLEEGNEERRLSIDSAWKVKTCNNMKDFDNDINFDYYISEAKKLVITS